MKFKFNYLAKKLWRIEGEYAYEVSEEVALSSIFYAMN